MYPNCPFDRFSIREKQSSPVLVSPSPRDRLLQLLEDRKQLGPQHAVWAQRIILRPCFLNQCISEFTFADKRLVVRSGNDAPDLAWRMVGMLSVGRRS